MTVDIRGEDKMQLPYSEELNIERLGRLFDNTSECYKFFWFKAIITKVIQTVELVRAIYGEQILNEDIRYRVYREGFDFAQFAKELKSFILPAYQSAQNCGFNNWKYQGE